ncbi:MAG: hypothetical protein FWE27_07065 [Defluviitaleaceae bacterium]|nr:hypothetical protein [Defluviitaleaceae bacterium]
MVNSISSVGNSQVASRTAQQRVNLPSFMLSTTEPKMSDEEFEQKIIELAKRHQAAGKFQSQDPNSEFHDLRRSFISVASPDREGMINKALPTILGKIREYTSSNTMTIPTTYQELIMKLLFGIDTYSSNMNKGQQTVLFELYDASGNNLATLTTGGWHQYHTPAESARDREFITIFNKAWTAAKFGWDEERTLKDGWAMESENAPIPSGVTPNLTAKNITTVDASELQPQQGQAASKATARYEANLHGATA